MNQRISAVGTFFEENLSSEICYQNKAKGIDMHTYIPKTLPWVKIDMIT